jgi:hypothetical protein
LERIAKAVLVLRYKDEFAIPSSDGNKKELAKPILVLPFEDRLA